MQQQNGRKVCLRRSIGKLDVQFSGNLYFQLQLSLVCCCVFIVADQSDGMWLKLTKRKINNTHTHTHTDRSGKKMDGEEVKQFPSIFHSVESIEWIHFDSTSSLFIFALVISIMVAVATTEFHLLYRTLNTFVPSLLHFYVVDVRRVYVVAPQTHSHTLTHGMTSITHVHDTMTMARRIYCPRTYHHNFAVAFVR